MGKKSRRSKPKNKPKGGGAAARDAAFADDAPPPPPPGATCWICLDGDPDEGGNPIVRDCACRGDDAGFVHLSCLVNYAENKSNEIMEKADGESNLIEPWQRCPNCKQNYARRVAIDMANNYMSFLEENFSDFPSMKVEKLNGFNFILNTIMDMDFGRSAALREEGKKAANQMMSEIEEIDESTKGTDGDIVEAQKIFAITALGRFSEVDGTREGRKLALECQRKVRDYLVSEGDKDAEMVDARMRMRPQATLDSSTKEMVLKDARDAYNELVREDGDKHAAEKVQSGINLAQALLLSGRGLEVERLLRDLEAYSHRVFGPDHPHSKCVEERLKHSERRIVGVHTDGGVMEYDVISFNSENGTYDVEGKFPVHGVYEFGMDDFQMAPGTPVICHGLKNAQHLNGRIGDIIRYDSKSCRYEVRFEDKSLKPASVKDSNLRILFDLPDKQ